MRSLSRARSSRIALTSVKVAVRVARIAVRSARTRGSRSATDDDILPRVARMAKTGSCLYFSGVAMKVDILLSVIYGYFNRCDGMLGGVKHLAVWDIDIIENGNISCQITPAKPSHTFVHF
ncbi:hypothetical protein QBC35DRAFT_476055 [Podospora australis]|uniref:Uncharacterized protein n=1 Tax=Podospora australis TaxID=1536484 RepID=A0AAN6WPQ9_9PEZI|nr:hypothetical protein QBC35DRAFT_476055 [Podospora australis]